MMPKKAPDEEELARWEAALEAGKSEGKTIDAIASGLGVNRYAFSDWARTEERRPIILAGIAEGLTYKQIGEKMDISGDRVRQIINERLPEAKELIRHRKSKASEGDG